MIPLIPWTVGTKVAGSSLAAATAAAAPHMLRVMGGGSTFKARLQPCLSTVRIQTQPHQQHRRGHTTEAAAEGAVREDPATRVRKNIKVCDCGASRHCLHALQRHASASAFINACSQSV